MQDFSEPGVMFLLKANLWKTWTVSHALRYGKNGVGGSDRKSVQKLLKIGAGFFITDR